MGSRSERREGVLLDLGIEDLKIVESSSFIPFCPTEQHHMDADRAADIARAIRPRAITEYLTINI